MTTNHLEQLIAEWYEYQGYFVRRNVLVGRRARGGYECELDIVAFHPGKKHLVHIEPSLDADSWAERERRFAKKFLAGRTHIPTLFQGLDLPAEIEQIAVLVFASKQHRTLAGAKLLPVDELLAEIFAELKPKRLASSAIPEHLPTLRTFQFVSEYRAAIIRVWEEGTTAEHSEHAN